MAQKVDLRIIKTRRSIEEAFIGLLEEKQFEKITVQNILDKALVNRKTFYKHYEDKYNLADTIIERVDERFEAAVARRFRQVSAPPDLPGSLRVLYEEIFEDKREILALMDVHTAHHNLPSDFRTILKRNYLEHFVPERSECDPMEMDYLAESYTAITFASIRWALMQGTTEAIDVICNVSFKHSNEPGTLFMSYPTSRH